MLCNHISRKNCSWYRTRFSEYLDHALPEDVRIEIHEHLGVCQSCSDEMNALTGALRMLVDYGEETLPVSVRTFRLPRSTFVEIFPTIQEERPSLSYGMLIPYLSALVLFFMVITTWIQLEKHIGSQYNESNYVEVYGN